MSDTPVQLIVVAFKDEKSAGEALKSLKQAQKEKLIKIENAAVLRKDEKALSCVGVESAQQEITVSITWDRPALYAALTHRKR